uniref:Uncharacterized protein TCIL3000_10_11660 n=1 Tax=Trypanosoma congolense (strain IL3000) TaxID=1068625 RepID=G0UYB8_TRYCI|nr:unnamed protein product [Trypanosoma congolense IL3000]
MIPAWSLIFVFIYRYLHYFFLHILTSLYKGRCVHYYSQRGTGMMLYHFVVLGFWTFITCSRAFELSPINVTHLSTGNGIWRPSRAVTLQDGVHCFQAHQEPCTDCRNELSGVCTFDRGNTFSVQQTTHSFCGNRGVAVNGTLLCPLRIGNVSKNVINVSVVSYRGNEHLIENLEENRTLSFNYIVGEEVSGIDFKGNTLLLDDGKTYLMNAVISKANASSHHVLFDSVDGFNWNFRSKIPFDALDDSALMMRGTNRLMVSTFNATHHYVAFSGYLGRWWGPAHNVSVRGLPSTLTVTNGIILESGLSNKTGVLELTGLVEGKSKVKVVSLIELYKNVTSLDQIPGNFSSGCVNELPCLTSSQVVLSSFNEGNVTVFFDFVSTTTNRKTIAVLSLAVNDTEEQNERLEELRKYEEEMRKKEEERLKYIKELEERRQREREEKLRREQERLANFQDADKENINIALSRLAEDGEMIVVREVDMETVDLEKQSFFW